MLPIHDFLFGCINCGYDMVLCPKLELILIIPNPTEGNLIIAQEYEQNLIHLAGKPFVKRFIRFVKDVQPFLPLYLQLEPAQPWRMKVTGGIGPHYIILKQVDALLNEMQIDFGLMKLSMVHKNWSKAKKCLKEIEPQIGDDHRVYAPLFFKAYFTRMHVAKSEDDDYKVIKYGLMIARIKGLPAKYRKFAADKAAKLSIDTNFCKIGLSHICPKGKGLIMDNGAIFESHRVLRSCPKKGHRKSFIDAMAKKKKKACAKCRKYTIQNQKCARCQSVFYCSRKCQKKHWKIMHRSVCKK